MKTIFLALGSLAVFYYPSTQASNLESKLQAIEITVTSTGCTKKSHFEIVKTKLDTYQISRIKPDYCRAKPFPKKLSFSIDEIKTQQD